MTELEREIKTRIIADCRLAVGGMFIASNGSRMEWWRTSVNASTCQVCLAFDQPPHEFSPRSAP